MNDQDNSDPATDLLGAARWLSCHPITVRRLCKSGELGFFRVGSRIRIPHRELEDYVARTFRAHDSLEATVELEPLAAEGRE